MPTPPSPTPTPAQQRDIDAAEATLDRLYPDWRQPPEQRRRRGGFAHLTPDQIAQVKQALKIRDLRLRGRDEGVTITWSAKGHPFAHPAPISTPTVDHYALREAMHDPEIAALLRSRGIVRGGEQ